MDWNAFFRVIELIFMVIGGYTVGRWVAQFLTGR
jgi:hypothetical protein